MSLTRDQRDWIDGLAQPVERTRYMQMAAGWAMPDWDRHLDGFSGNFHASAAELFVRSNGALMPDSVKLDFYNLLHRASGTRQL